MIQSRKPKRNKGVLLAVLKAFIPYTQENIMLAYKPGAFFNHLDKLAKETGASRKTINSTISRAKRAGLIKVDTEGTPSLTWRGKMKLSLRPQKQLRNNLVIIFDVPEQKRRQRDAFRSYLRSMHCEQVQKSVWKTRYDIYDELSIVLVDLQIKQHVSVFLADELY